MRHSCWPASVYSCLCNCVAWQRIDLSPLIIFSALQSSLGIRIDILLVQSYQSVSICQSSNQSVVWLIYCIMHRIGETTQLRTYIITTHVTTKVSPSTDADLTRSILASGQKLWMNIPENNNNKTM